MTYKLAIAVALLALFNGVWSCPGKRTDESEALIDLGYAKHIPTFVNTTSSGIRVAIYQNIRFANPPTGDLRFRKPNTNLPHTKEIQDGHVPWRGTDCMSSAPAYVPYPDINGTSWGHEDCLFLDVYVPEGVKPGDKVPVLHFIHGSAYAFGSKNMFFSPMGLFDRAAEDDKFILVANNYRLGMPGWGYSKGLDMDINVGLFDALAAVEWTSRYIEKFGGDRKRITASGQSAGAGMLYYLSTLHGGKGKLPFQKIFGSSLAAPPRHNTQERQKQQFDFVLDAANCTSLECLRSLPEDVLLKVNEKALNAPSHGGGGVIGVGLGFGPVADGKDIPDLPLASIQAGNFHKELKGLLLGSMANEGMGLSSDENMPEFFPTLVRMAMPTASNETVAALQALYHPEVPAQLAWDWTTDVVFACSAYNLAKAFPAVSRRYIMSAPPAVHGQDANYYFYNDMETTPVGNVTHAYEFQSKLLDFVHGKDVDWPTYGKEEKLFNITSQGFEATTLSEDLKVRCEAVNRALLDPKNGA